MIDAEVLRLRKLRNVALRTRALAKNLDSDSAEGQTVFSRSAVICWTIVRIVSGRLRAHPYLSYQQGPSALSALADGLTASFAALTARRQNRRVLVCAQQLQAVSREVDDVRALTWSPELSDALGRMQIQMRRLAHEFDLRALDQSGIAAMPGVKVMARDEACDPLEEMTADNAWPYLAI
jgi:hypothetical protein